VSERNSGALPITEHFSGSETQSTISRGSSHEYAEISTTNANFKNVYASLTNFANDGYQWYQVAELGFDGFMVRNGLRG
jgi:TRAP-type mannitol/chloroaromatic compound transport system substrate-binding protein